MGKLIFSITFMFILHFTLSAQNTAQIIFNDFLESKIVVLEDGSIVLASSINSTIAGNGLDIQLTKLDTNYNQLWSKSFGNSNSERISDIIYCYDKGFLISSRVYNVNPPPYGSDFYAIIKFDSLGNYKWKINLPGMFFDKCEIRKTDDTSYFVKSHYWSGIWKGEVDCFLKINDLGDTLINSRWLGVFTNYILDFEPINQSHRMVTFDNAGSFVSNSLYSFIMDFTPFSNYPANSILFPDGLEITKLVPTDNGIVCVGNSNNDIILIDYSSTINFKKLIGINEDRANSIIKANDGGFIICGSTHSFSASEDALLVKTDSLFNIQWSKTFGLDSINEEFIEVVEYNNKIIANGIANSNSTYLVITDQNGESDCFGNNVVFNYSNSFSYYPYGMDVYELYLDTTLYPDTSTFQFFNQNLNITDYCSLLNLQENQSLNCMLYPNPTTGLITIKAENIVRVEIINIDGTQVYNGKENKIDLSNQPKSIYILKLVTKKETKTWKIIKQ